MRFAIWAAAAAMVTAVPASAVTIVQTTTDYRGDILKPFDSQLGTLTSVKLTVDAIRYRDWVVTPPAGVTTETVSYSINGFYDVNVFTAGTVLAQAVNLTGGGTIQVDPSRTIYPFGGNLRLLAAGRADLFFDPSAFTTAAGSTLVTVYGNDRGYNSPADTVITAQNGSTVRSNTGRCAASEEECGAVGFTLTYDYTPALAPVPEPATWAMMVAGFGLAGSALRRRRVSVRFA